ncbi:MAG: GAF domain-containing sensor histidine kinase, partial [Chloroflexi bacterium]|nr:GAF domain-containing sensor histidine kinase [Chloroflexota bacterium]
GSSIDKESARFNQLLQNGLLFGSLAWIIVGESNKHHPYAASAHGYVNLVQSGYSPKVILSTVAQTIDKSVDIEKTLYKNDVNVDETPTKEAETRRLFERKLLEHQTLSSIARMINSSLDLTIVLTKVVDAATSLTNAEEGLLLLPDNEGKNLYIRAAKGIDSDMAKEFRIKTDDTLAGQVFKTGHPVLVGDSGWQKVKTEYFVKSLLYVPMTYKDKVIGVLGVNNRSNDRTFNAHDRDLLLDLASHAAIAIENARLYGESVQRSKELAMLFSASQAVNSTLALDGVLKIIAERLLNALEIGIVDITTFNPSRRRLETSISYQRAQWQIKQMGGKNDQPEALFQAIHSRQRVFLSPQNAQHGSDKQYLDKNKASLICVFPLMTENRPIGVFELVYTHQPSRKSTGVSTMHIHQMALQLMVMVDAMSLNNAEAQTIATDLLTDTGAQFCRMYLWDESQDAFYKRWSFGEAVWLNGNQPVIKLDEYPALDTLVKTGNIINVTRHDQDTPDIGQLLDQYGSRTLLVMPIVITGEVAGIVIMSDTMRQRHFSERKIEMANALIVQAANAMKNASLFADLQKSLEDLREAQSRLIQSARLSAMGELAAAVAHQINNPLTTVIADTELILQDLPEKDRNHESIVAVHRAGKRAHEVVRRLLGMAHQSDADDPPQMLDVNQTIRNTLTLVSKHIEQHHVYLEVDLEADLPDAYGLPGQLEDVWMNLLLNARDAVTGCDGPEIGIMSHLSNDQQWIEVEVWDNGTGIPVDKQGEIFDAFFTTKPAGEGTGLGLHICRQVVEKCKGELLLKESTSKGSTFLVRLPTA